MFDPSADRRAAIQQEQQERAAEREQRLASQHSPLHAPAERIRIWERLHELTLPKAAAHKLVRIIAAHTNLTVQQVHDEQRRRAECASMEASLAPVIGESAI